MDFLSPTTKKILLWKERFADIANRELVLDKFSKAVLYSLPTADELRRSLAASENAEVRQQIAALFDKDTFVETGAYTKRGFSEFLTTDKANELEGVITGYGAIDGKLVFVFAEDATRMGGAIDEHHAKKITDLYALAMKNGAPVIGMFNSRGADIFSGTTSLAAYARIMKCISDASGAILQIALVMGKCVGTMAAMAAMFDFTIAANGADYYVNPKADKSVKNFAIVSEGEPYECIGTARALVSFLPENSAIGCEVVECSDNLNRTLGELDFGGSATAMISTIADNGMYIELASAICPEVTTVFSTIGGVKCGVIATSFSENEGRITALGAKKIARFVSFCDCFSIPVVTLVDSLGLSLESECESDFADLLADLAYAYATADNAKVTVIAGHAIGASFALLGSKALGADVVYCTDSSEIGALPADSGVAFAWDKYITTQTTREELISEWKSSVASPVAAASSGEIDDIISTNELRARICSALLMLSAKGQY